MVLSCCSPCQQMGLLLSGAAQHAKHVASQLQCAAVLRKHHKQLDSCQMSGALHALKTQVPQNNGLLKNLMKAQEQDGETAPLDA